MAFYNIDNQVKRRQMELAEKEQRLANDPGHIFMKSLASSAPQQLMRALGSVGVNLAKGGADYALFGGKERSEAQIRKSEAEIADLFPDTRVDFLKKNYPGAYEKSPLGQAEQRRDAAAEMDKILGPPTTPTPLSLAPTAKEDVAVATDPMMDASYVPKEPVFKDLGGGRFAFETDQAAPEGFQNTAASQTALGKKGLRAYDGKIYRIVDASQKKKIEDDYNKIAGPRKQYQQEAAEARASGVDFIAPEDRLPEPSSLLRPEALPVATATSYGYGLGVEPVPLTALSPYPPTKSELAKQMELNSLERRKIAELTQSQRKKKQDLVKAQYESDIKNSYNYLALTSKEQLAAKRSALQGKLDRETDPVTRDLIRNVIDSYPKESQRAEAERLFRENKGTVSVGSVRIGERNKVVVNYNEKPTRMKVKDAAMDAQSEINRMDLILADPKRADEHEGAQRQRASMLGQLQKYAEMENVLTPILIDPKTGYLIVKAGEESKVGKPLDRPNFETPTAIENAFNSNKKRSYDSIQANPGGKELFTQKVNKKVDSGMDQNTATEEAAKEMIGTDGLLRPDLKGPGKDAGKEGKTSYPNLKAKKAGVENYALGLVEKGKLEIEELQFIENNAGPLAAATIKQWIAKATGTPRVGGENRAKTYYDANLTQ